MYLPVDNCMFIVLYEVQSYEKNVVITDMLLLEGNFHCVKVGINHGL